MQTDSARTRLYHHPAFAGHDTTSHPENPSRVITIDAELQRRGLLHDRPSPVWEPASNEQILRVHDARLLSSLEQLVASGGGAIDPDTIVFPDSLDVARLAAGAGIHAVESIAAGDATTAVVLDDHRVTTRRKTDPWAFACSTRSPSQPLMRLRRDSSVSRSSTGMSITGMARRTSSTIGPMSSSARHTGIGRYFYPGTGAALERGIGAGTGFTVNVPLAMGDGDAAITAAWSNRSYPLCGTINRDLILISAGFDALSKTPWVDFG
jgi:acetoin utilization deacetylase AcuC-like enzyme